MDLHIIRAGTLQTSTESVQLSLLPLIILILFPLESVHVERNPDLSNEAWPSRTLVGCIDDVLELKSVAEGNVRTVLGTFVDAKVAHLFRAPSRPRWIALSGNMP